jgi:DNA repair protein RadC
MSEAGSKETARKRPLRGRLGGLAEKDRPREKLLAKGAAALSDEELVAVLLGTGKAGKPVLELSRELVDRYGLSGLFRRGGLAREKGNLGVGPAKAARIAAAAEIAARVVREEIEKRSLIANPGAAADYLQASLATEQREVMGALLLDARNRLLQDARVFAGGVTSAAVSPGPLFKEAILAGAVALVLYHNHPSGDAEPSADDRATTTRFAEAGRAIGIEVRDHIVVGRGRWVSFRQRGWLAG